MFGDIKCVCVCICIRSVREEMEISEDTMNNNQARNTPDCNNNGNLRTLICTVSSSIELTRLIVAFFTFCIYPLSYNASSTMVIFMFEASISGESGVLYCSIVVELRGSEDCNGVLHQLATSRQMAKEHHDHDIDVEGSTSGA